MIKTTNKRGIALISLGIAIVILIMLSGIAIYVSSDMATEAREVAFAKDTANIYDSTQEYYAINGGLPIVADGIQIDAATYKGNITDSKFLAALTEEIANNQDENAIFYEIDMTKIGIEDSKYGLKKDEDDIYLVSNTSHFIYYYPGIKIGKNIYFSNSNIVNK